MMVIEYSGQFKRDVKQAKKQNKNMDKLKFLMQLIVNNKSLPKQYLDHPLKGNMKGFRDAHIEPDWLLIYKKTDSLVRFERTGNHADIFG